MRAPDKIYACETDVRGQKEQIWLSYPLSTTDNFEYIRKDALLEWLKERRSEHSFEVWKAYQRTIEKIQSL